MRKTLLNGLIAAAFAVAGSAQAGPLSFSLDGSGGNVIVADALDWSPTSFLALGGNQAITNKVLNDANFGGINNRSTTFDVLTHAKMNGFKPSGGGSFIGLPGTFGNLSNPLTGGEITIIARFSETVTSANTTTSRAEFDTVANSGWVEMYYSAAQNANDLTGSGFSDGTLIMRATGTSGRILPTSDGTFKNNSTTGDLDVTTNGNDYTGQKTVNGSGSQSEIRFGSTGIWLNKSFLLTNVADFSIFFQNISIGLPYSSVDPSDCFNPTQSAALNASITAGTATGLSQCDTNHVNGLMSANAVPATGYLPLIGATNGAFGLAPDFMAQTDFNSSVTGTVPEPGMLALLGLAFAGMGLSTVRRRRS